jgi:hypothetical protein
MVAISEGNCKLLIPDMECPEVQPPAYRAPNPTKIPPINNKASIFPDDKASSPYNSVGT